MPSTGALGMGHPPHELHLDLKFAGACIAIDEAC